MARPKMSVEGDELWDRAEGLEYPMPAAPSADPHAPCALDMSVEASRTLRASAERIRTYLDRGAKEWGKLAQSLRNAAQAYEEVDFGAAEAISVGGPEISRAVSTGPAGGRDPAAADGSAHAAKPYPIDLQYVDLRTAAEQIQGPDQGVGLRAFAEAWERYSSTLVEDADKRFRDFRHWEGDAAEQVAQNFKRQFDWVLQMVDRVRAMAKQAKELESAHHEAVPGDFLAATEDRQTGEWWGKHPTLYEVRELDRVYNENWTDPYIVEAIMKVYQRLTEHSRLVLSKYARSASLPLVPINPPSPPAAHKIDPLPTPEPDNPFIDVWDPDNVPSWPDVPEDTGTSGPIPGGDQPYDPGLPDPTGMPTVPSAAPPGTGPDPAALAAAAAGVRPDPTTVGAGVKPASLGDGGIGGAPPMPLQPSLESDAAARAAAAGRDAASLGRGVPGAGGAMGGGMGMPMAPGAAGQGQSGKGKRSQSDEEALYTEERPWTEAVIGNRPRPKPSPDIKDLLK
ncbi:PPE domain-containing protein [Mycobacterium parmense]|uniref:ESX-1 secretion-associated protein EspB n=1 Tax=Mycobacterium parmense TaxID=185642 RepID=A0A7I7YZG3_9MYCO|nr:hypothetical protein [Mycobacterium parmense]MCV7352734.1 hypothetical protein [Mycobacterium parmense]ORW54645.1 hypothetical protein AWC20_19315 [Mycobacterium parmense]BBZ46742.1 ESX-1 secretion-associated protein EspB [Mycobacterium parmense]